MLLQRFVFLVISPSVSTTELHAGSQEKQWKSPNGLESIYPKYLLPFRHNFVLQCIEHLHRQFGQYLTIEIWGVWLGRNNFPKRSTFLNIDNSERPPMVELDLKSLGSMTDHAFPSTTKWYNKIPHY